MIVVPVYPVMVVKSSRLFDVCLAAAMSSDVRQVIPSVTMTYNKRGALLRHECC